MVVDKIGLGVVAVVSVALGYLVRQLELGSAISGASVDPNDGKDWFDRFFSRLTETQQAGLTLMCALFWVGFFGVVRIVQKKKEDTAQPAAAAGGKAKPKAKKTD